MQRTYTLIAALALGTLAWAQSAQEEELKSAALKAKIVAELATVRSDLEKTQFGVSGALVTGAPYSAEAVTETVQILGDGNAIRRKTVARVFRDGAGRTARQEPDANGEFQTVQILDPVAGVTHVLNAKSRTAASRPLAMKKIVHDGDAQKVNAELQRKMTVELQNKATYTVVRDNGRTETLAPQIMEGVKVEGTRTTQSIPAGTLGNDRAIDTYSERWYSPDLQVVVMTKRHDPRSGDVTYQLQRVTRNEPAPYLFQVPADYKVETPKLVPTMKAKPLELQ